MVAPIDIGLIGAGYIADWHAQAIRRTAGIRLAAVCDPSAGARDGFAARYGVPGFADVGALASSGLVQAVHVLTPPDSHHAVAATSLDAGLHTLVEKPVALDAAAARDLAARADERGVRFTPGHNFLGLPAHARLRRLVATGRLGLVSSVDIGWHFPLSPMRAGPFGLWMLREPGNLLRELGPHLFAFAHDLAGPVEVHCVETGKPVFAPGSGTLPQSIRILARAAEIDVNIALTLAEVMDDRRVIVRGSSGIAELEYGANRLTLRRDNTADIVLNPALQAVSTGLSQVGAGLTNLLVEGASLNRRSAYAESFAGMMRAVYGPIRQAAAPDPRYSAAAAVAVAGAIDDAIARMPRDGRATGLPRRPKGTPDPTVLIVGGTGFIGRHLANTLAAQGRHVRILSRGGADTFGAVAHRVEVTRAPLSDPDAVARAMEGIETVFHLAKTTDKTWDDALRNDVGVTEALAQAALKAGVDRFVYTGTIASYDMSDPRAVITEATGFAEDMGDRNIYARSKAECERRLTNLHLGRGLPLVIARPGIVIGPGGPLQHWGIGRWHGAGAVRLWGQGRNILPFVDIADVVDGLIRMADDPAAIGGNFNLVGEPLLTGRGYFDAIARATGARVRVRSGPLWAYFAADAVKYQLKMRILRKAGAERASLRDWRSRAHLSRFDNALPKRVLGWTPEADRDAFIDKTIRAANLFGF